MDIKADSPADLDIVVKALLPYIEKEYSVVLLHGELGAGKTTLIQLLCKSLGVDQQVTSPTFSIVQEYLSPVKGPIYHMDLYRLEKKSDLEQVGFEEYLDSGHLCLIEWPALGNDYYVMPYVGVEIEVRKNKIRNFKITTHDAMDT